MPSKFGGTWTITSVKFADHTNPMYGYDLSGFGKRADNIKEGDILTGYISTKNYTGKDGTPKTSSIFNAITPEYVYGLVLKMNPEIETVNTKPASVSVTPETPVGPDSQDQVMDESNPW